MQVDSPSSYTTVFTATAPGIYLLVLKLSASGSASVRAGSAVFMSASGAGNQGNGVRYLDTNDTLEYQGPLGELMGVRLPSEL